MNPNVDARIFFANATSIHRVAAWLFPGDQPQHFRRLNEAHPDLKFDPFLAWRVPLSVAHIG